MPIPTASTQIANKEYADGKADDAITTSKDYSDQLSLGSMTPDYANIEPGILISAINQTWTANRAGFVRLDITNDLNAIAAYLINGARVIVSLNASSGGVIGVFPVKPEDVVSVEAVSGNFPNNKLGSRFIPPVRTPIPWQVSFVPDYAAIETINRISTGAGQWTADRDGFVLVICSGVTTANNGWFNLSTSNLTVSTISCRFIPPVHVQAPWINEAYSTTEVDTGKKWIDGKTIYRKVFTGNFTAIVANTDNTFTVNLSFDQIIKYDGYWNIGNGYFPIFGTKSNGCNVTFWYPNSANNTYFTIETRSTLARTTAHNYVVIVEYTK